jgi:tight adherence protein B
MNTLYYAAAMLVFIAVALVIEAGWQWWFSTQSKAARRLSRRLQEIQTSQSTERRPSERLLKDNRLSQSTSVDTFLRKRAGILRLQLLLQQSGKSWRVADFLSYTALVFMFSILVAELLAMPLLTETMLVLPASSLPLLSVLRQRHQRLRRLELQLPEAADLISRSLRAGHALMATLQMLADEMPDPIAAEFRIVSDEINFGLPMSEALQRLGSRVPLPDLQYLIIAILIQRETGGNLSELMNKVSELIRQRLKLLGQVRVMSAEGRLSAWILCLLPVSVSGLFFLTSPDYLMNFLNDPAGSILLALSSVLMLLGILWMRAIVQIRV